MSLSESSLSRRENRMQRKAQKEVAAFDNAKKQNARKAVLSALGPTGMTVTTKRKEKLLSSESLALRNSVRRDADVASLTSHERAIIRGSHRGLFELNERRNSSDAYGIDVPEDIPQRFSLDLEHRTATTAHTSLPSYPHSALVVHGSNGSSYQRTKPRFSLRSRPHSVSEQNSSSKRTAKADNKNKVKLKRPRKTTFLTSEIHSPEAWMCGVCAKAFSTIDAAERHEQYHVQEVVCDLGWLPDTAGDPLNDDNVMLGLDPDDFADDHAENGDVDPLPNGSRQHPQRGSTNATSGAIHPCPDVLTKSPKKPSAATKRSYAETGLERIALSEPFPIRDRIHSFSMNRSRMQRFADDDMSYENDRLLMPHGMKDYVVLADEGLIDCCRKAEPLVLSEQEREAEADQELLSNDKQHYDFLTERRLARERKDRYHKLRTEGATVVQRIQNKFVDAYQLMKEGNTKNDAVLNDAYNRKLKGDDDVHISIEHNKSTVYVNVVVKNSVRVVSHELERLAKRRWEDENNAEPVSPSKKTGILGRASDAQAARFQKFRAAAQINLVKLAGLALASDFTPRRIAVQLSNDVYRRFPPRLKRYGVTIEREIEYRVGPFFVLAVNFREIDWHKFLQRTHHDVMERQKKWKMQLKCEENLRQEKRGILRLCSNFYSRRFRMSKYELFSYFISFLYYFHWTIYLPICLVTYRWIMGNMYRTYVLQNVADETFVLVEEKGMEMQVGIRKASKQAAFMLSALREIREGGKQLKKKQKESQGDDRADLLGPLLGPAIKDDKGPAPPKPDGFEVPESLEFIGLELTLPVGFRRLRWALLHSECRFMPDAVFRAAAKYDDIRIEEWSKHNDIIGLPTLPEGVKEEDLIGAERVSSYLMPKSAFVKANVCTETAYIEAYNDYCFALKKKALTPDVPYGSTFVAWTKYIIINTGNDSCKMTCSVEAEFPNGPPIIARQIKSGMRAGVGELFVLTSETITKYADEFPK